MSLLDFIGAKDDGKRWSLKKKENELALHRAEMIMIRWIFGAKLTDKLSSIQLRQRLGTEDLLKVVKRDRL